MSRRVKKFLLFYCEFLKQTKNLSIVSNNKKLENIMFYPNSEVSLDICALCDLSCKNVLEEYLQIYRYFIFFVKRYNCAQNFLSLLHVLYLTVVDGIVDEEPASAGTVPLSSGTITTFADEACRHYSLSIE